MAREGYRYTNRAFARNVGRLTKAEMKAIQSCAKSEPGGSSSVLTCAMKRLDLSPNMPLDQYDRLQAAAFKAHRRANRYAIKKNYGVSGVRRRKRRRR
jgi:hypothetical protein